MSLKISTFAYCPKKDCKTSLFLYLQELKTIIPTFIIT